MKLLISTSIALGLFFCVLNVQGAVDPLEHSKVVCFWNSTSFLRNGPAKFNIDDLKPALPLCTHLVYGFAGIREADFEVIPLNPNLDTGAGYGFYRLVTQLKRSYPDLKIYLSIGGNADPDDDTHKYLTVTETAESRSKFISSVIRMLNDYEFDGIDLAWEFPPAKVKKNRGAISSFFHGVKSKIGLGKFKDEKEEEHRVGFNLIVQELRNQLRAKNKALTITVLPHVNASVYFEPRILAPNVDAIHLFAFDQKNPTRNPKEADFPAPVYESYGRVTDDNLDYMTRYWLERGTPGSKIVPAVPTFARTWKLNEDTKGAGVPPVDADGPGAAGPHTETPGLRSYAEVCASLTEHQVGRLRRVNDPSKKYGNYAYQLYNSERDTDGIWMGFEDPDSAGNKALYSKSKGLGGIAIYDLSLDDFRGVCNGDKYPIVKGAKSKL